MTRLLGPLIFVSLVVVLGIFVVILLANAVPDGNDEADGGETAAVQDDPVTTDDLEVYPPELPPVDTNGAARFNSCSADEAVSWSDAGSHVGVEVGLIGPVEEVTEDDQGFQLVIGQEAADPPAVHVRVVQSGDPAFAGDVTEIFSDEQVCVVGVIQEDGDGLQMVINERSDIRIL